VSPTSFLHSAEGSVSIATIEPATLIAAITDKRGIRANGTYSSVRRHCWRLRRREVPRFARALFSVSGVLPPDAGAVSEGSPALPGTQFAQSTHSGEDRFLAHTDSS
jgi:hypothetical protein